jgi:neurotransmitter:Na+ symporter, NSS family
VILAVMGSAVGLGNFLRFPGLAAKYEGGTFMIPYFTAFLLLGLPLAWAEWAMGRSGGSRGYNSAAGIYRSLWRNPASPYFGVLAALIPIIIYMYYVIIEAWCLGYAIDMARGALRLGTTDPAAYQAHFDQRVGVAADGALFSPGGRFTLLLVGICFLLNFTLIYRGVTKGIEWFCKWAMPALLACALVLLVRVLTLGTPNPDRPELNVISGLGYMWNPRVGERGLLESLMNGRMWLEAAGQIFFSLSVGFGIIVNYASYVRRNDDIALSGLTSAAGNEFTEVSLAGLTIVPAAFMFFGAQGAQASTFSLGFTTLPMVFATMPGGQMGGTLFFVLLFLAALTSSLSMLQPAIALLEEGLGLGRRASVTMLGFITAAGTAFVLYFSGGLSALDTFDFWVGTFCIFILAAFQVILFGWIYGIDRGHAELQRGAEIRVPRMVMFIIKYVAPLYLLIVFVGFVWQEFGPRGDRLHGLLTDVKVQLSVGFIIGVAALFTGLVAQSVRRWRQQDADAGRTPEAGP